MSERRGALTLAALAVGIGLISGCSLPGSSGPGASTTTRAPSASALVWTPCGELPGQVRECSSLQVPLDYADPVGRTITLALARIPARGPGERLGSILVDPGGPGISGVGEILNLEFQLSEAVEARYDIVGWDRRGVGRSSPVWCRSPQEMRAYAEALAAAQWEPQESGEVEELAKEAQAFADGCRDRNADIIAHIGTRNSARDMDSIRAALGEPRLNYVGWSHGTKVGAFYIDMFPNRVGRMVLDSAIDPSLSITDYNRDQSRALEDQLMRFIDYCAEAGRCPLPADRGAATVALRSYLESLPVTSDSANTPTRAEVMASLAAAMYVPPEAYPDLIAALRDGLAGDGSEFIAMAGLRVTGENASNMLNALYAINCFDSPPTPDVAGTAALAEKWGADTAIFGAINAWGGLRCHDFPAHDPQGPSQVRGEGAPPVVVVGALLDGATPVHWSRALASQLVSARLVIADTDVHAVYPTYNACVARVVDSYLLDGVDPPRLSECPAD